MCQILQKHFKLYAPGILKIVNSHTVFNGTSMMATTLNAIDNDVVQTNKQLC